MLHVNSYYNKETFHAFREYSTILNIQHRKTEHYSSLASCPKHIYFCHSNPTPIGHLDLRYEDTEMKKLFSRVEHFVIFILCHLINFITFIVCLIYSIDQFRILRIRYSDAGYPIQICSI